MSLELIFGVPARGNLGLKMAGDLALIFLSNCIIICHTRLQFVVKRSFGRGSVRSNVETLYLLS